MVCSYDIPTHCDMNCPFGVTKVKVLSCFVCLSYPLLHELPVLCHKGQSFVVFRLFVLPIVTWIDRLVSQRSCFVVFKDIVSNSYGFPTVSFPFSDSRSQQVIKCNIASQPYKQHSHSEEWLLYFGARNRRSCWSECESNRLCRLSEAKETASLRVVIPYANSPWLYKCASQFCLIYD